MIFYDRLSELCEKYGTTVSRFSIHVLGCSNGTASGWKKGASPNSAIVAATARHFNVSTDFLLGLSDDPLPPQTDENSMIVSEDERFYLEKLRDCDLDTRQRIMISGLVLMGGSPDRDQLPSLRGGSQKSGSTVENDVVNKSLSS